MASRVVVALSVAFLLACADWSGARDLARRVKFAQLYGEPAAGSVPLEPATTGTRIDTGELEGLVFKVIRGPGGTGGTLRLRRSREWKFTAPLIERVFDRKCLTGSRFGVVARPGKPNVLVLLVDQPGIRPLEGVLRRLPAGGTPEPGDECFTGCRYVVHLPLGSMADGETVVLGAE